MVSPLHCALGQASYAPSANATRLRARSERPWLSSAAASSRVVFSPVACSCRTIGSTLAAKASAPARSLRPPLGAPRARFVGLPSLTPCAFLAASAALVRSDQRPLFLGQRGVEVQHERVGVAPSSATMNGTRCAIRPEMNATSRRQAVELGDDDRALGLAGCASAAAQLPGGGRARRRPCRFRPRRARRCS